MGVGVESPVQPSTGPRVITGSAVDAIKDRNRQSMGTSSASAAASTRSPAEPVDRRNGDPASDEDKKLETAEAELSGLDSSRDSITIDVESTGEGKTSVSAAEELRTPLNNVTNTPSGVKAEEHAAGADWSEYFLGDMALSQWLQSLRRYVLVPLIRHPRSLAFRKPVDPVALGIYPIYNQIIARPMDLGTIKTRVDKNLYNSKEGVLNDINLVWNNALKFNPVGHAVHDAALFLQKHTRDQCLKAMVAHKGNLGTPLAGAKKPVGSPFPTPMRQVGLREARKKAPLGLPGEYDDLKPQHLEQKYASKLSEPLKACDGILRNLLLQSQHKDYVEPFIKPSRPGTMCFGLIKDRLRTYHYTTSLDFANDMRRIVTETYRAAEDPETDFRSSKASKLQREFERQYALVNTFNEGSLEETCKSLSQSDPFIGKLLAAKNLVDKIQSEMSSLVKDYDEIKMSIKNHKREIRQQRLARRDATPTKRKRTPEGTSPGKPPAKKQKTLQNRKNEPENAVNVVSKKPTAEQIGEWIGMLEDSKQESLLEILRRNGENIEVGSDGSVELSLETWSEKTLDDVELFLRREIPTDPSAAARTAAGNEANKKRTEVSSSESDSSSSDNSSSSEDSDDE